MKMNDKVLMNWFTATAMALLLTVGCATSTPTLDTK